MVKYAQSELFSITDFTKQIGSAINDIKQHSIEKIGILKNNKLEAVVISTDEYERLKSYEEAIELEEHTQIYNTLEQRKDTPLTDYVSMDDMAKKFDIDLRGSLSLYHQIFLEISSILIVLFFGHHR